ncbi:hypothetical protein [Escherichia phage BF17]|uniref:Scaffolding domain delta n=3 Tax=root TaxID=1 RepID=A0AAU7PHB2_9CAUD|nr:hypothetical protein [Escherichia coli]QAY00337.1 hypothetical protein Ecwhy1_56 [Escherichia phage Ecwhy_1]QXN76444.1 hypothetical protein [Escherichia phage BF17]WGM49698.1 hypothetical protein EcMJ_456 [Escherichia phage vB_Ec-M-J]ELW0836370.1 hypothetical protein [Escherichia coli]
MTKEEMKSRLSELKKERKLVRLDWDILNKKDEQSYANWSSDKVRNDRSKEDAKQFMALTKRLSSLNSEITGLQKEIISILQVEINSLYE